MKAQTERFPTKILNVCNKLLQSLFIYTVLFAYRPRKSGVDQK